MTRIGQTQPLSFEELSTRKFDWLREVSNPEDPPVTEEMAVKQMALELVDGIVTLKQLRDRIELMRVRGEVRKSSEGPYDYRTLTAAADYLLHQQEF